MGLVGEGLEGMLLLGYNKTRARLRKLLDLCGVEDLREKLRA